MQRINYLLLIFVILALPLVSAETIEGNKVKKEDPEYNFSLYPFELAGSGWAYGEFTPVNFDDKINILTESEGRMISAKLEEYDPHIYKEKYFSCDSYDILNFDIVRCTFNNGSTQTVSYTEDLGSGSFRKDYYKDYKPITHYKNKITDKEHWINTDYKVTKGETFKFRIWYDIPHDEPYFKYNISVVGKSHGNDKTSAKNANELFKLDPWGYGDDGMEEYFELNNNTLYGSIGNYNLTNTGTTNTSGFLGSARAFSGAGQYMSMSDDYSDSGNVFFMHYMIYVNAIDAADGIIVDRSGGTIDFDHYFSAGTGELSFRMTTDAGVKTGTTSAQVPTGQWIHVAVRVNGSKSDSINIYINCTESDSSGSEGTFTTINNAAGLGIDIGTLNRVDYWLNGKIDEVGFWKDFEPNDDNITELCNGYTLAELISGGGAPPGSPKLPFEISNFSYGAAGGEVYVNGTIFVTNVSTENSQVMFEAIENATASFVSNGTNDTEVFFKEIVDTNTSLWDETNSVWKWLNNDNITVNLTTGHSYFLTSDITLTVNVSQDDINNFTVVVASNDNNFSNQTNTSDGDTTHAIIAGDYNISILFDNGLQNQTYNTTITSDSTFTFNYSKLTVNTSQEDLANFNTSISDGDYFNETVTTTGSTDRYLIDGSYNLSIIFSDGTENQSNELTITNSDSIMTFNYSKFNITLYHSGNEAALSSFDVNITGGNINNSLTTTTTYAIGYVTYVNNTDRTLYLDAGADQALFPLTYTHTMQDMYQLINITSSWLDNCSVGSNKIVYFNVTDENWPTTPLPVELELEIIYGYVGSPFTYNYTVLSPTASNHSLCYSGAGNITYDLYLQQTQADTYTHRYYVYSGVFTNGSNDNFTLYNFNSTTDISELRITARHLDTYQYYPGVVAKLQRKYLAEGLWRTVQMDQSGDFGLLDFNVIERTTDYKIVFLDTDNNVLKTTDTLKFACTGGLCELTQLLSPYSNTTEVGDINFVTNYYNDSGILIINWSQSLGASTTISLRSSIERGSNTLYVCLENQSGSGGSFVCNMSAFSGIAYYNLQEGNVSLDSGFIDLSGIKLGHKLTNLEGALWALAIIITIAMVGLFSPVGGVMATMIGLIIVYLLGIFTPLTLTFVLVAAVISILIGIKVKT